MSHAIVLLGMDDLTLEVAGYVADLDAGGDPKSPGTGYRITDIVTANQSLVRELRQVLGYAPGLSSDLAAVENLHAKHCLVGDGDITRREQALRAVRSAGANLFSLVHPTTYIARGAQFGAGCILAPLTIVCAKARIGENALIGPGSMIGREVVVPASEVVAAGTRRLDRPPSAREVLASASPQILPSVEALIGLVHSPRSESAPEDYPHPRDVDFLQRHQPGLVLRLKDDGEDIS